MIVFLKNKHFVLNGDVSNSHALGPVPTTNTLPVVSIIFIVERFIVIFPSPDFNVNILAVKEVALVELKFVILINGFVCAFTMLVCIKNELLSN